MSLSEVIVEGTLTPAGTLELDQKPNLAPGRVRVIVQPLAEPIPTWADFWTRMQAIRDRQKASGHIPRSAEEVERERRALRDESEEEILEALGIHEACKSVG